MPPELAEPSTQSDLDIPAQLTLLALECHRVQVCRDENIECGFQRVNGYLFPHENTPDAFQALDLELMAAKDAKVPGVERVNLGTAQSIFHH